jgi:predicted O-methyltransferase YrrM
VLPTTPLLMLGRIAQLWRRKAVETNGYGRLPDRIEAYERTYDARFGDWREGPEGKLSHATVELEVGRLWYAMVALLRPTVVVETGTWSGYSTCCIAAALRHCTAVDSIPRRVHTADVQPREHLWTGTELEGLITFHRCEGAKIPVAGPVDMLVIDSEHDYPTVSREIEALEPALAVGGVALFHDALYFDGVGAAVRTLSQSGRFEVVTLDSPRHTLDFPRAAARTPFRCPGVTIARKVAAGPAIAPDPALAALYVGDIRTPPLLRPRPGV